MNGNSWSFGFDSSVIFSSLRSGCYKKTGPAPRGVPSTASLGGFTLAVRFIRKETGECVGMTLAPPGLFQAEDVRGRRETLVAFRVGRGAACWALTDTVCSARALSVGPLVAGGPLADPTGQPGLSDPSGADLEPLSQGFLLCLLTAGAGVGGFGAWTC